jgi:hypothetical protein
MPPPSEHYLPAEVLTLMAPQEAWKRAYPSAEDGRYVIPLWAHPQASQPKAASRFGRTAL